MMTSALFIGLQGSEDPTKTTFHFVVAVCTCLAGSSPANSLYGISKELGIVHNCTFLDHEEH